MDTLSLSRSGRKAYLQRRSATQQRRQTAIFGAGRLVRETGGLGADLFRHALTVIGVGGLVSIAVGALTGCRIYESALSWVTSFFVR